MLTQLSLSLVGILAVLRPGTVLHKRLVKFDWVGTFLVAGYTRMLQTLDEAKQYIINNALLSLDLFSSGA